MFTSHRHAQALVIVAGFLVVAVAVVLITPALGGEGGHGEDIREAVSTEPAPTPSVTDSSAKVPETQVFETIEEAQPFVPFKIRTPPVPHEFPVSSVRVIKMAEQTVVDILYETSNRSATVRFAITTQSSEPWGQEGDARFTTLEQNDVEVNGDPGVAVTARSTELVLGYLFWQDEGLTYQLWYPGKTGTSLVPLAEAIE